MIEDSLLHTFRALKWVILCLLFNFLPNLSAIAEAADLDDIIFDEEARWF